MEPPNYWVVEENSAKPRVNSQVLWDRLWNHVEHGSMYKPTTVLCTTGQCLWSTNIFTGWEYLHVDPSVELDQSEHVDPHCHRPFQAPTDPSQHG